MWTGATPVAPRRVGGDVPVRATRPGRPDGVLTGEFRGLFKYRVGDWRVIYARTAEGVLILRIAHRREAHR